MFRRLLAPALIMALSSLAAAQPLTTAFTFQGDLKNAGSPASGTYDARFRLYDALTGGTQLGPTLCADNIAVANGAFTTQLDFGPQFSGQQRFLEIDIRQDTGLSCSNSAGFTTLGPRQALTAAPNADFALSSATAIMAQSATTATTATNATQFNGQPSSFYTNAANLTGALPSADLTGSYNSVLNLTNSSNTLTGTFAGSGAGLTNIPWSSIVSPPNFVQLLPFSDNSSYQLGNVLVHGTAAFDFLKAGASLRLGSIYPYGMLLTCGPDNGPSHGLSLGMGPDQNTDSFYLSSNFTDLVIPSTRGSALCLDGRPDHPAMQFIMRPAGTWLEYDALDIAENAAVLIPNVPGLAFPLEVDGGMHLLGNNADGEAISLGSSDVPFFKGITTEDSQTILNFDMNFRADLIQAAWRGAAVRLDSRSAYPAIQFLTRPAGTINELVAASISDHGLMSIGNISANAMLSVSNTGITGTSAVANFVATDTSGVGAIVNCTATSGPTTSLRAFNSSPAGNAGNFQGPCADVVVVANTGSGRGIHVTTASDTGVWSTTNTGIAGVDGRTNLSTGFGVIGQALATSGVNYGIRGNTSSPTGFGVYSSGAMGASGTKAFRIDHPADPEHKYLLHYCTESPEVLNAYSGKVTLNQQGEATIELPAYFARINKDPRYTLTPVGAAMPLLHIAEEVSDDALEQGAKAAPKDQVPTCSFTIAGGAPNAKVCWRVEAVRNDRWVQTHGAPVEANKEGPEDGTYQHPDLYNQPAEKSVSYQSLAH